MADQNKRNMILIMADQFRADALGVSGNSFCLTPNIDNLADIGCHFNRGYSPSPTCVPARACLITGKRPSSTGFFSNDFSIEWNFPITLMQQLRDSGYQTLNVGKNHFHPMRKSLGFEVNCLYEVGNDEKGKASDYHRWLQNICGNSVCDTAKMYDPNAWTVEPWTENPRLHPTEWTADTALEKLELRDPTRPFYLQVSFQRPHPPLDPPKHLLDYYMGIDIPEPCVAEWAPQFKEDTKDIHPFEGKINRTALKLAQRAYYAAITHIDLQVGKILSYLQRNKLFDDTSIFFVSDHGELLGDHNMFRKGPPYEGSARIPFIVKFAKGICEDKRGKSFPIPVTLLDIFPTCMDLARIPCPPGLDGLSLQSLVSGTVHRECIFGENYRINKQVTTGGMFVVDERYKYVWNSYSGIEQLFDLENDQNELFNLAANPDYQEILSKLRHVVIDEYKSRPWDGMLDSNGTLMSGKVLPAYRAPVSNAD